MFEVIDSLCQRYYSLNPFIIWNTPSGEVFKLIRRIQRTNNYKEDNNIDQNAQNFTSNSKRINVTGKQGTGGWI